MTIEDVLHHTEIDDAFSATDQSVIEEVLRTAYARSPSARAMLDKVATEDETLYIDFSAGQFGAVRPTTDPSTLEILPSFRIMIDLEYLHDAVYISPTGRAIQATPTDAILHELVHAIEGSSDGWTNDGLPTQDTNTNSDGPTVRFANGMYEELGIPERLSYSGAGKGGDFTAGSEYTNGQTIDVAILGRGFHQNVDTSTNAPGTRDLLVGSGDLANSFKSGAGNDFLYGNGGNDTLDGGQGDDILDGGLGSDTLRGEGGNDFLRDTGATFNYSFYKVWTHSEDKLYGGAGADTLYGDQEFKADWFRGDIHLGGVDYLDGGDNDDFLYGVYGNDTLFGGSGVDGLWGGDGNDTLDGGLGNDMLVGEGGRDVLRGGGVTSLGGSFYTARLYSHSEDTLYGGSENDQLFGDQLVGDADDVHMRGNDLLSGDDGDDLLNGVYGDDRLYGGSGIDKLDGGTGTDNLIGGANSDVLTGGPGGDFFGFDSKAGTDTLTDFLSGTDKFYFKQDGIRIGDGDALLENGSIIAGPGGFAPTAELVIAQNDIAGSISATSAAGAIGAATGAYALGVTALFAVDNATQTGLFLFTSAGTDAIVSAAELTQLALATATPATATGDYLFVT